MNIYSEIVLFAVVLAANLVLLGAILAGGLALAFRFIENVSPQLRCCVAVAVFALAILLPVTVTLKIPSGREFSAGSASIQNYAQESVNYIESSNFESGKNAVIALPAPAEHITSNPLGKFISIAAGSSLGKVFFGLWMAGIAWLLFREALGIRRLRQARNLWQPGTEAQRAALLCPKHIPLYFDERQSPGTVGLVYPAIVLPRHFSAGLTTDAKVFIVRHELAHAQKRDPLASFILRLLRAVFWISPALWLLERLIDAEREAAADRAAIGLSPHEPGFETSALNYADTLLTVARELNSSCQQQHRAPHVIGIGTRSELEIRIRRLLSVSRTTRLHMASASAACALSLVMLMLFPGAGFSEQSKVLQSRFIDAAAERKSSQPDEGPSPLPIANQQNEMAAQSPARAGDHKTPGQARTVKTKSSDEAARSLIIPAEILSRKTVETADSAENQLARRLPISEDTGQGRQMIYGPARKSESELISSPAATVSNDDNQEPARQKREDEYQSFPANNQMPAKAPR